MLPQITAIAGVRLAAHWIDKPAPGSQHASPRVRAYRTLPALAKGNASLAASAAKSPTAERILAAVAASMWPPSIEEQKMALAGVKAAVAPGTTYTTHWAQEIAAFQAIASSFIAGLKGYCAFDTMAADFVPLPPHTYTAYIGLGGTKTGSTPGEWLPIPATDMSISADFLRERLSYALVGLSEDVLKFGQGFDMLNNGLRRKLKRAIDSFFLNDIIGTTGIASNAGTGDFASMLALLQLSAEIRRRENADGSIWEFGDGFYHPDTGEK